MRDYTMYEKTPVMFSGAERKFEIIIEGYKYIVKFQKNSEVGLTFNCVSEYLGSHIFQAIGIPVQETFLGTYDGKNVVVMKNFLEQDDALVAFNGVGESSLERDKELYNEEFVDTEHCNALVCANVIIVGNNETPDIPVVMTHFLRPVEGGSELRSRFWFGYQIIDGKPVKMIPDGVSIPEIAPVSLLNHNVKEFANLAAILPSIYAEEKENW